MNKNRRGLSQREEEAAHFSHSRRSINAYKGLVALLATYNNWQIYIYSIRFFETICFSFFTKNSEASGMGPVA